MTNNTDFTACFTGHRHIDPTALKYLPQLLETTLTTLIHNGCRTFRAGGALGFDTLAALKVLELKASYPQIRLHLYLPCRDQTKFWNDDEKYLYQEILTRADDIHYTTDLYTDGCMLQRNREMIDGCDICVAYFQKYGGGTGYSYRYAQRNGVQIINLAEMISQA
ncbi:MAG: DUF1273 family protein [Clostridia bacterium]|nr:DUF1273 family protein [Clostridia bacterium]MBQ7339116.1 DUF1273 family protein [Clostridia bacterium]